jgi:predicted phosphodiesterase
MTAIGLISDVHAMASPVREALAIFAREGVEHIFCAGDIAGYHEEVAETIALLAENGVRSVRGNHDVRYLEAHGVLNDDPAAAYFRRLPAVIDTVIEDRRVYMVHAEPPDACAGGGIRLLDRQGAVRPERAALWQRQLADCACDVLIVGHTHQVFAERLGAMLVVNPGSTAFNHSCAILRLPELSVQVFALSGQPVTPYWNWSEYMLNRAQPDTGAGGF